MPASMTWAWSNFRRSILQSERQFEAQAKQIAINYEIPLGQLVHAF
jgi:hypothetical protein